MKDAPGAAAPYHRFRGFIAPEADRFSLLKLLLEELRLHFSPLVIAGGNHLLVGPERGVKLTTPGLTVLVSHYDRVPGSPGANDNSAAVFQLTEAAVRLNREGAEKWLVIFTDKEEIQRGEGIQDQGSYSLALGLKKLGLHNAELFIFDACGTGDTIIVSTTIDRLLKEKEGRGFDKTQIAVTRLRTRVLNAARRLALEKVLLSPTPFSDDAGFFSAGLSAQTITVLPSNEASRLALTLRSRPQLAEHLVKQQCPGSYNGDFIPQTWKRLNGPGDREDYLTPKNYAQVVRLACALAAGSD